VVFSRSGLLFFPVLGFFACLSGGYSIHTLSLRAYWGGLVAWYPACTSLFKQNAVSLCAYSASKEKRRCFTGAAATCRMEPDAAPSKGAMCFGRG
jgi:hypothetical protein